jgi:predicted DNA-binding ribbon-helix-helix protein
MYIRKYVMEQFVTTVKLDNELYSQFKEINVRSKISFQDFVNKCLERYVEDASFRNALSESVVQKLSFNEPFKLSKSKDKQ